MDRGLVSSGSPYEGVYGYSRAVRVGPHVVVAGTCAVMPDGADPPPDAYGQARRCFEIIIGALEQAGASAADVVRTRMFLRGIEDADQVGRAHGELFGDIRPASTMLVVRGFIDPRWVVEIEADAVVAA